MTSIPELVTLLEDAIMSEDGAKLEEVFDIDVPVGLKDQFDAASEEMRDHMMEHSGDERHVFLNGGLERVPQWLRRKVLENLAAWNLERVKTCRHAPDFKAPRPVFMAAWMPRTVVCEDCAMEMLCPDCGTPEDILCDGCGAPLTDHKCEQTHALVYGPSTLLYGVCGPCAETIYNPTQGTS